MRIRRPVRFVTRNDVGRFRLIMALFLAIGVAHATETTTPTGLDRGFSRLYDLDFRGAQEEFQSWEQQNPDNPMGPVGEAAGILFSEFNRLGVLEAQFYENDSAFAARKKYQPDAEQRGRFEQQLTRAETLGKSRLARDSRDHDALLGLSLASGLRADYAALIEKRSLSSLHYTKESSAWADQLLASHPTCYDGYLAGGISRYLVGSMSAPVRWLLRMGGVSGDKARGISELQTTAAKGQLLAPFARILLAIAYVRDKDKPRARETLLALQKDFPNNHLFPRELARLEKPNSR
ncbi:MAG TPA: hypothetical protein VF953_11690 [Terriglobales bacterium]